MSIRELMGIAIGNIGMLLDDFLRLEIEDFRAVYAVWCEHETMKERTAWERTRTLAAVCIQPYSKKRLIPKDIISFPWDNQKKEVSSEIVNKEAAKKRLTSLLDKIKK